MYYISHRQIEGRTVQFDNPTEGIVSAFLSSSARRTDAHLTFLGQKAKNLTAYIHKLEAFLEVREHGVAPNIWDEYVRCVERKTAEAAERGIARSVRNLINNITGFKASPMFRCD